MSAPDRGVEAEVARRLRLVAAAATFAATCHESDRPVMAGNVADLDGQLAPVRARTGDTT